MVEIDTERGVGYAEYTLLFLLVVLVVMLAITVLGQSLSGLFNTIQSSF